MTVAAMLVELQSWRAQAACSDPMLGSYEQRLALFFDESRHADAKAVCARCPVQTECAAHATVGQEEGVWGATTANQRMGDRVRERTEEVGWLSACQRCSLPFVVPRLRHGMPPSYCGPCKAEVRAVTVARSRQKRRALAGVIPLPGLAIEPASVSEPALAASGRTR